MVRKRQQKRTPESTGAVASQATLNEAASSGQGFPIVGIGASAGGLAAFESFFSAMPSDTETGMAFVLVQHLSPDHKSILVDLVRKYTRMKVFEVEDGMKVEPNCTYVIPPNRDMALMNGYLHLLEPSSPRGVRLPIDFFFRSLAQDQHQRAICIVLSGTGSDGTSGVRAVKGEGGMAMAQHPDTTEYDGMPRSAIATGLVDFVLPPAEMPAELVAYVTHAFGNRLLPGPARESQVEDFVNKICVVLRAQTGHDFSEYKSSTIGRRIERRMAIHQIEHISEYLRFLQGDNTEVNALFRDLLIGVTSFFRDPEAFAVLQTQVIPRIFANKDVGDAVRIWVCGCSTGEEAYSIAILVQEQLEILQHPYNVVIFATDIDAKSIEQARTGIFPVSVAADISAERLARFFTPGPGNEYYRIQKSIRDMLIFSEQDVVKDPPFSRVDLISCRNLLIYMTPSLQRKLLPLFHYALKPEGVLFLGTSETIGENPPMFSVLDRRWKLYVKQKEHPNAVRPSLSEFVPAFAEHVGRNVQRAAERPAGGADHLRTLTEKMLLAHYAQAAVLINLRGDILHIYGRTGQYLEPAPGDAAMNVFAMAREGLRRELSTAVYKASAQREMTTHRGLRVKTNGNYVTANLVVLPLAQTRDHALADYFLIILEEALPSDLEMSNQLSETGKYDMPVEASERIARLEEQLRVKEEYLQSALEEMETSTEELKSTNEELQSVNEELQSTNEELETSKEELQSVNEELTTVNAELQTKVSDLSRSNNDMNNLLAGTGVGTLFVDHRLNIARFTPAITQIINLIQSDVGRPVAHIVSNLIDYDHLVEDVQAVLDTLTPIEAEVQTRNGAWYLMRIRPYRTLENVIEGAVLTFVDVTERRLVELALESTKKEMDHEIAVRTAAIEQDALRLRRYLNAFAAASAHGIALVDAELRFLQVTQRFAEAYGWTPKDAIGKKAAMLWPARIEQLRDAIDRTLDNRSETTEIEPESATNAHGERRHKEMWRPLFDDTGALDGFIITLVDGNVG